MLALQGLRFNYSVNILISGRSRGGVPPTPLLWVKKKKTTEGRTTSRASKTEPGPPLCSRSGSATVDYVHCKCTLCIVMPSLAICLELLVIRVCCLITNIMFICVQLFLGGCRIFTSRKLYSFLETFLCFLHQ